MQATAALSVVQITARWKIASPNYSAEYNSVTMEQKAQLQGYLVLLGSYAQLCFVFCTVCAADRNILCNIEFYILRLKKLS